MPRSVARTEELPKIRQTLLWHGLSIATGSYTLAAAGQHPRMRLIGGVFTPLAVGATSAGIMILDFVLEPELT